MNCVFKKNSNGFWQCKSKSCGWTYPFKTETPPHRNCTKRKSKGLGDTIAKLIRAVGIKPCGGCKKRQKLLNKLLPYRKS